MMAKITAIWRLESTANPFEDAILNEIINNGGRMELKQLESLSTIIDSFGPLNYNIIGFPGLDRLIKPRIFRLILESLANRGLLVIDNDMVVITPQGKLVAKGVKRLNEFLGVPTVMEVHDNNYILYPGAYMYHLSNPPQADSFVVPKCEIGIHNPILPKGGKTLVAYVPVKILLPIDCHVRLIPIPVQ